MTLKPVDLLLYVGIVTANLISWLMTSHGFIAAGFVPIVDLIQGEWIVRTVTAILQLVVLAFQLKFPPRTAWSWTLMLPVMLVVLIYIGLEVTFSTVSATEQHRGRAYYSNLLAEIDAVNNEITTWDDRITSQYRNHLHTLENLIEREVHGTGRTGHAGCGPDCKEFRIRLMEAQSSFSDLTIPIGRIERQTDAHAFMQAVISRVSQLEAKITLYNQFAKTEGLSLIDLPPTIRGGINRLNAQYFDNRPSVDRRSLHFNTLVSELLKLIRFELKDSSFVAGVILACLPILGSFSLALLLKVSAHERSTAATLEDQLREQDTEKKLLRRIVDNEKDIADLQMAHSIWKSFKGNVSSILGKFRKESRSHAGPTLTDIAASPS